MQASTNRGGYASRHSGRHEHRANADEPKHTLRDIFGKFSELGAQATGSSWAFVIATLSVVIWAVTGPLFGYSDTWQLVINTATTVITFLMVFIIQAAQNRDTRALQLKLDEVLRKLGSERMIDVEDLTDTELERIQKAVEKRYGSLKPKEAEAHQAPKSR